MPSDGVHEPPFTPAGKAAYDSHKALFGYRNVPPSLSNDPRNHCDPLGFPRADFYQLRHTEILQSPKRSSSCTSMTSGTAPSGPTDASSRRSSRTTGGTDIRSANGWTTRRLWSTRLACWRATRMAGRDRPADERSDEGRGTVPPGQFESHGDHRHRGGSEILHQAVGRHGQIPDETAIGPITTSSKCSARRPTWSRTARISAIRQAVSSRSSSVPN